MVTMTTTYLNRNCCVHTHAQSWVNLALVCASICVIHLDSSSTEVHYFIVLNWNDIYQNLPHKMIRYLVL